MKTHPDLAENLFGAAGESVVTVPMRLLRRGGNPFLLLPAQPRLAVATLSLYEPQRPAARLAVRAWKMLAQLGFTPGQAIKLRMPDSLSLLLRDQAPGKRLPTFGALLGNPNTPGRRFLILTGDETGSPSRVTKVGFTAKARNLIQHEADFLGAAGVNRAGLPQDAVGCQGGECAAVAMGFFAGRSPRPSDDATLPDLLSSWLQPEREVMIGETAAWRALAGAAGSHPLFAQLAPKLAAARVHPALQHGDLTPWNVKVGVDGRWTVLDWERGEVAGLPLWDWLHFIVQRSVLAAKLGPARIADDLEKLLRSAVFSDYARRAGCAGLERELTLAYLLHIVEVIRPSEGRTENGALLALLQSRWLGK